MKVSRWQGDASRLLLVPVRRCSDASAVRLKVQFSQSPAAALVSLTGTGKHKGYPFLPLPAFLSPSSASSLAELSRKPTGKGV